MKTYNLLWIGLIAIGLALMIFKIIADSEPGAIPLFLILLGLLGYFISRYKRKA